MDTLVETDQSASAFRAPLQTPKSRSFSDTAATPQALAPSPSFNERLNNRAEALSESKDDHALPITPRPLSRRSDSHSRGLSLQMPPRLEMPSPSQFPRPVPLSPQLDQHNIYMQQSQNSLLASPATSLPRHSRGLDFSRASTNLHHSTIADQRSGDSSPIITQKGVPIPSRRQSVNSMMLDSPAMDTWGSVPERSTVSSSIGSINMLGSDSESSDSDGDASMGGEDLDDAIFTTPQVHKIQNPNSTSTPFGGALSAPNFMAGWATGASFSPAQASLMKAMRRSKVHKSGKKSRMGSSSASNSGYSSIASPRAGSPPPMRSIEGAANMGYFGWGASRSRRESLALGTGELNLSSGNDSGDEASTGNTPSTPGVVRRAVTRRGNLLPKTKGFARIRAALAEEAAPVDTESRREAETIRQVRDRDGSISELDLTHDGRPATAQSSPNLLPAVSESAQEDFGREFDEAGPKGLGMNFAAHASRNSGGLDYWNRFDPSLRTPPPPTLRPSSSMMSDSTVDGGDGSMGGIPPSWRRPRAQSSTSEASDAFGPSVGNGSTQQQQQPSAMNDDVHLKKFKRRREDDFDIATIKRRAVSPGMSAQNSPVLTQSPSHRGDLNSGASGSCSGSASAAGSWGQPPENNRARKESLPQSANSDVSLNSLSQQQQPQNGKSLPSSQQPSRHGSTGSSVSMASGCTGAGGTGGSGSSGVPGKKLGLQGMLDTNDGLMKMSIE